MPEDKHHDWSQRVTKQGHALDLEPGLFSWDDPKRIAAALKRSAKQSQRRKADPFRSAMSILIFYINSAGKHLPNDQRQALGKVME